MAKINPPRKRGQRVSSGIPTQPWAFHSKQFWRDMSDNEFQRHLGMSRWQPASAWPFVALFFSISLVFIGGLRAASLTATWTDYFILGLAVLGLAANIVWLIKASQ